jgi:hypothetical protein
MAETKPRNRSASYLTVPQFYRLNVACHPITKAFHCPPYLVGSVLHRPDFRDVDLRLPMSVERAGTDFEVSGPRLKLLNVAISDWLAQMTDLPIDFQFQPEDEWVTYDGEMRNPMGLPR